MTGAPAARAAAKRRAASASAASTPVKRSGPSTYSFWQSISTNAVSDHGAGAGFAPAISRSVFGSVMIGFSPPSARHRRRALLSHTCRHGERPRRRLDERFGMIGPF